MPSTPIRKDPPKPPLTEIDKSEFEFEESTAENMDETGSESVSESDPDLDPVPVLARKKAPETKSRRQPPLKTKAAPRPWSPMEKSGPRKLKSDVEKDGVL